MKPCFFISGLERSNGMSLSTTSDIIVALVPAITHGNLIFSIDFIFVPPPKLKLVPPGKLTTLCYHVKIIKPPSCMSSLCSIITHNDPHPSEATTTNTN